jgi:hypothetical protein
MKIKAITKDNEISEKTVDIGKIINKGTMELLLIEHDNNADYSLLKRVSDGKYIVVFGLKYFTVTNDYHWESGYYFGHNILEAVSDFIEKCRPY